MRKLLAVLIVLLPLCTMAQKVDVTKDKITVDEADYAVIEKDGCGAFSGTCEFNIKNLAGKKVLVVKALDMKDPDKKDAGNPEGMVHYLQFIFLESKQKTETDYPSVIILKPVHVAKMIVKAELFKNGELDAEAVSNFVLSNGVPYTDRKKEMAEPKVIIIEKE
jgi:hypothetical protein